MLFSQLCNARSWKVRYLQLAIFSAVSTLCLYFALNKLRRDVRYSCTLTENIAKPRDRLPQLPSAEFYVQMLGRNAPPRRGDEFDPQINETELRATVNLLGQFLDLCEKHGIQAMLFAGTLLGSYRHHGFIPWDDDLDLLLNEADRGKLGKALDEHSDLQLKDVGLWKISLKSACLNVNVSGCWPFIDVGFYELQGSWVVQTTGCCYRGPAKYTFPVHKRPFMGRWVDSPKDAAKFLSYAFSSSDACYSRRYSHKFETSRNVAVENRWCRELARTYSFVLRVPDSAPWCRGVLETLRLPNGEIAYTVLVDEPIAATNAFSTRSATWLGFVWLP